MSHFDTIPISICGDCLQVIANDCWDFLAHLDDFVAEERKQEILNGLERECVNNAHIVPGGSEDEDEEGGFSHRGCELCRSGLGDHVYPATIMIPRKEVT